MKKSYEVVWEIFNECANNQMRDIFIEEIETEDTDAWIRSKVKDQELVYDVDATGTKERFSFTEI